MSDLRLNKRIKLSEIFLNYMTVMVGLFRSNVSLSFKLAIANFYTKILNLVKVYRWQKEILTLTVDFYTQIVEDHSFDPSR